MMDRPNAQASAMKRRAEETPETLREASKKTRLYNNTRRSSSNTGSDYDDSGEEEPTAVATAALKTKASSSKGSVPKIKVNVSKTSSKISKVITESKKNGAKVSKANTGKQTSDQPKPLKRKSTGDEPDEESRSPILAKKAKVAKILSELLDEELSGSDCEVQKTHAEAKTKITPKGSENGKASKGQISAKAIVEADKDHETPNPQKTKNPTTAAKLITSSTNQVGGILGRGDARPTSRNDLPAVPSEVSSLGGGSGSRASHAQIPEVDPPRNAFIVTDPNKPRPRGLGRLNFKETPAYTKLMEVANQVKRVAGIMTDKLIAAKAASGKDSSTNAAQTTITEACEKLEKFMRIYSPQVKFLSVEEHTALVKAAVQCLGDVETAELPNDDFQKVLCSFLDRLELGENQATTVGLYPILELYKVGEEAGELSPDVKKLIASINACLIRKSREAEARLVSPDYIPEDYLTKMQKRVLAMGNVSKPVYDDWEKFLKASARPKAIQRAQRLTYADQVCASYQPLPPVLKPMPKKSDWVKNHMISKIISKYRTNKRFETKMSNAYKVKREYKSYEAKPDDEPMVYSSYRRPLNFDETKEARQILEYDSFGRPLGVNEVEQAGDSIADGSSGRTLEF